MRYQLRHYQATAIDTVRARVREGFLRPLVVAPTGAGKTVIAAAIMESVMMKLKRCMFLAHRGELIDQTCEKLTENGLPHGVIKAGDPRVNYRALLQVGSVQTVVKRLARLDLNFDVVIFDECHRALAATYQLIATAIRAVNPSCVFIGLTATPYRSDGKGLGDFFDTLVEVATVEGLIDEDFLVSPKLLVGARLDLAGLRIVGGDYSNHDLGDRVNKPKLVGNIVEEWRKHAADRLAVAFCVNVAHAYAVAEAFAAAGIAAKCVEGKMKPEERANALADLRAGELRVVTNCMILTEGFDLPDLSAAILARPTKSRGLWKQMVGRILRPAPGKFDALILDHANCRDAHGYVTEPDRISLKSGIENSRPRPARMCPACRAKFAGSPKHCPACGALLRTPAGERLDEELAGLRDDGHVLVEDTGAPRAKKEPRRMPAWLAEKMYRDDLATAKTRGYKPGWAAGNYHRRTGAWPTPEMESGSPIRTAVVEKDGKKERVLL